MTPAERTTLKPFDVVIDDVKYCVMAYGMSHALRLTADFVADGECVVVHPEEKEQLSV